MTENRDRHSRGSFNPDRNSPPFEDACKTDKVRDTFLPDASREMLPNSVLAISVFLFLASSVSASSPPSRPRGVAKSSSFSFVNSSNRVEAHLYLPSEDGTWKCLDGSKVIPFDQVNDVYSANYETHGRITVIVQTVPMNQVSIPNDAKLTS